MIRPLAVTLIFAQLLSGQLALGGSKEFEAFVSKAPCIDELKASTSKVFFNQTWYPLMISRPRQPLIPGFAFRNTITGNGYQLFADQTSTTLVESKLNGDTISANVWDTRKSCRLHSSDYKSAQFKVTAPARSRGMAVFNDSNLNDLLKSSSWGVIYVWSPFMPLSIEGIKEIRQAMTEKGKGKLTILVDGKANIKAATDLVEKGIVNAEDIRQVDSPELLARGVALHYPSAYIYKSRFLSNRSYIGHKSATVYSKWIDSEIKALTVSLAAMKEGK